MRKEQLQQGDVLFIPLDQLPDGLKASKRNGVVMEGELTGHAHRLQDMADKVDMYEDDKGVLYLRVKKPTNITHEEHMPVTIPEGIFQIGRVREWDYFKQHERAVKD